MMSLHKYTEDLPDENPLNSLGGVSLISRSLGSDPLSPGIDLQELPGIPETLPSLQDKSCNILIGKHTEEISVNSLN